MDGLFAGYLWDVVMEVLRSSNSTEITKPNRNNRETEMLINWRMSDQNDYQRQKSDDETRAPNPQSRVRLVV